MEAYETRPIEIFDKMSKLLKELIKNDEYLEKIKKTRNGRLQVRIKQGNIVFYLKLTHEKHETNLKLEVDDVDWGKEETCSLCNEITPVLKLSAGNICENCYRDLINTLEKE